MRPLEPSNYDQFRVARCTVLPGTVLCRAPRLPGDHGTHVVVNRPCEICMLATAPLRRTLAATVTAFSILACGDAEPSGPARIPTSMVAQTPTTISATVGTLLPAAPSVVVLAQDGRPLRGSEVHFAITGGGAIATPIVKTNSRGIASSGIWTLGTGSGSQTLTATVGTVAPIMFTATATPGAPASSVARLGDAQTGVVGSTLATTPTILVRDRYSNPVPGVPVTFSVRSGGGTTTGTETTTDANGLATLGSWTLGTTSGVQKLGAAVFGLPDAMFSATSVAGSAHVIRLVSGAEQIAHVGSALSAPVVLDIRDRYDNPAADRVVTVTVTEGGGTLAPIVRTTTASGLAIIQGWRVGLTEGLNSVAVSLEGLPPLTILAKAVPPSAFDVTMRYLTPVSSSQHSAFEAAAVRWRKVITGDAPDLSLNLPQSFCELGEPALNETIDDLLIYVQIITIDGPGRILGQAGPCAIRTAGAPGLIGIMRFDIEDVMALEAEHRFEDVILHEMGHVLGIGSLWPLRQLITGRGGADPYYTGANGRSGFAAIGGGAYSGTPVPIEMIGGSGTRDSHWRESILASELMTGFVEGAGMRMPLSLLTIGALRDLGYEVSNWGDDRYDFGADVRAQLGRSSAAMTGARELLEAPLPKAPVALDPHGRVAPMPMAPPRVGGPGVMSAVARPAQQLEVRRRP